jgi:lipopolysaccharide biosynthesis regulator YciM
LRSAACFVVGGETDRAIRMHQNLIEREDLKQDLKLQALAELGQDYLKAGLLDRAEEVFDKLRDSELAEAPSATCSRSISLKRTGRRR